MNDLDTDLVMTVPEVAAYLKLAPSTIYRLAKAEKLPGRKVGGAWRFSRQGIEEWLRQTATESSVKKLAPTEDKK